MKNISFRCKNITQSGMCLPLHMDIKIRFRYTERICNRAIQLEKSVHCSRKISHIHVANKLT